MERLCTHMSFSSNILLFKGPSSPQQFSNYRNPTQRFFKSSKDRLRTQIFSHLWCSYWFHLDSTRWLPAASGLHQLLCKQGLFSGILTKILESNLSLRLMIPLPEPWLEVCLHDIMYTWKREQDGFSPNNLTAELRRWRKGWWTVKTDAPVRRSTRWGSELGHWSKMEGLSGPQTPQLRSTGSYSFPCRVGGTMRDAESGWAAHGVKCPSPILTRADLSR